MREEKMKHMLSGENTGLCISRNIEVKKGYFPYFLSKKLIQHHSVSLKEVNYILPLYVYKSTNQGTLYEEANRNPNLDLKIVSEITEKLSLHFIPDHELPEAGEEGTFTPLDLLDYIYAVLHSPSYREKYKEFLKIDFPRIPYPDEVGLFWKLVNLGRELRELHLMESPVLNQHKLRLDGGDNLEVKKPRYEADTERVYINKEVYFEGVPKLAWEFYIGGYQPAQKWLKDRKGRTLDFNDVRHYMKIIVALIETDRIMREIDDVKEF